MSSRLRFLCVIAVLVVALAFVPAAVALPLADVAVSGVVTNATSGVGVPFVHIVVAPGGGGSTVADVMADYRGRFSMTLPPATYLFTYWIPGGDSHLEQVIIPAEPTADASHEIEGYRAQRVYRFFNMKGGVHFYTASDAEFINTYENLAGTFKYDGVAYYVGLENTENQVPLYRFFNRNTGVHFYTASEAEKNNVIATRADTYTFEGMAYGVRIDGVGIPVYRFYVPSRDAHFYTAATGEIFNTSGLSNYYHYEGIGFWVDSLRK